jgi:thiol-disulfide isomerase/thioredoxin
MFRTFASIAAQFATGLFFLLSSAFCLAQSPREHAGLTVLYFQTQNCPPCRQLEPLLVQYHQRGWDIRMVDAPNQLEVARQFQIQNLPTLVLLSGGKEVDRMVGLVSEKQLNDRLTRLAARSQSAASLRGNPMRSTDSGYPQSQPIPNNSLASGSQVKANSELVSTMPLGTAAVSNNVTPGNSMIVRGQSPSAASRGFPLLDSSAASDASPRSCDPSEQCASATNDPTRGQVSVASHSVSSSHEQAIARAADATVRIKVEESNTTAYGTGTIVAIHQQEALILTCGHLFRDMLPGSQLKVDLFAGTARQTTVLAQLIDFKADKEDIGLLSIRLPVAIEPALILPRSETVQVGQQVFSFGCDHGNNPTRRDSRVTHVNRYLGPCNIEIEGAPAVGRSGGGLFDVQGRLIGVCNAACSQENEGIYASASVIYEQLARIDHSHLFELATKPEEIRPVGIQSTPPSVQVHPVALAAAAPPNGIAWPDETSPPDDRQAIAKNQQMPNHGSVSPLHNPSSALPNAGEALSKSTSPEGVQVICVVRTPGGTDRVVTIHQAPENLLSAIEQYSNQVK